jgi:hypothetical protein
MYRINFTLRRVARSAQFMYRYRRARASALFSLEISNGVLTFGALGALWSSSSAMNAIIDTLNQAYGIKEARVIVAAETPDVVVSDLAIPVEDGLPSCPTFGRNALTSRQ